jgi:hypothetical protein
VYGQWSFVRWSAVGQFDSAVTSGRSRVSSSTISATIQTSSTVSEPARMRPAAIVVAGVGVQDSLEMSLAAYERPVQALSAHRPHPRSAKALARGARIRVRMTLTPSVRKTSSNAPEYLASRSQIRNRMGGDRLSSTRARFRAV